MKEGSTGPDQVWRHIVTIYDAAQGGCNLFDLNKLKDEYSPDEFANLFGCQFVDDSLSAFKFNELQKAFVDSLVEWNDVNPESPRPYGDNPVWAGYDPQESEDGDNAALVIAAPPKEVGGHFRILERYQLKGYEYLDQAKFIREILNRYNYKYLGIDNTGVGSAVYQILEKEAFPGLTKIDYSLSSKAKMVMKAQNIFRLNRLEMDSSMIDIASAFISIKKTLTDIIQFQLPG